MNIEGEGKKEQFSFIYDKYIEKIYRFVYLKVDGREAAEDITSKVFTSGWDSYRKDENIKNIGAFLYRIARNATIDYYKKRDKAKVVQMSVMPEAEDQKTDLHEQAILSAETEKVKSAIQNLKKDYQDVLILHYLEDIPVDDVASIMSRPSGTIRVMIHRGLKDLRKELDVKEI